jgi:hypothetical protein
LKKSADIGKIAGLLIATLGTVMAVGCGGSGGSNAHPSTGTGQNVQSIAVSSGPLNNYINGLFTSVTVCVPGSTTCQTIDNVLVDTGSSGLRLLSSGGGGTLTLALPQQTNSGNPVGECAQFADGVTWGAVKTADIQISGEKAGSVPVQVIADTAVPTTPPSSCSALGTPEDNLNGLLTNGILGISAFAQDCGAFCTTANTSGPPAGWYYACPSSGCVPAFEDLTQQLQNPVTLFATDNNGVIIQLPSVPAAGSATVSGSLIFGIGTQTNNSLGSAKVFAIDQFGNFTTIFNSKSYTQSFLDSGTNGLFFLDSTTTGMATCSSSSNAPGFYCPSSSQNFSATQQVTGGSTSNPVSFSVDNASNLVNSGNLAFVNIGAPNPGIFDWGLPFFYGKNVFTAIEGQNTPAGVGPFWAY